MPASFALNVALIEDDPAHRAALAVELDVPGRSVVTGAFADAESALRALPAAWPDVVLVDLGLPGLDGVALIARLRALSPALTCVVHTSREEPAHIFAALKAGAVGYLLKSSPAGDILVALEEAVAGGAPLARSVARQLLAHLTGRTPPFPHAASHPASDLLPVQIGVGALRFVAPAESPATSDAALDPLAADDRVFLKNDRAARFVPLAELAAVVSADNYTEVFVADGSRFLVRRSLKTWEAALPGGMFVRVHRQSLVNLAHLERIEDPDGDTPSLRLRGMKQPIVCSHRLTPELRRRLVP